MAPQIVRTIAEARAALTPVRQAGRSIGLVPTMGALHEGHASLLRAARKETDFVVASIFVNPSQFGPNEDLSRYPRPFDKDLAVCAREATDLIFHPEPAEIYPAGFCTWVEVHGLQDRWEGATRPGHFRGVATVVLKLFNIVQPHIAYFGQKDAQQTRILEQMVRDLNVPLEMRICPTVREADGLALSSRNQYLDAEERRHATVLYQALDEVRQAYARGEKDAGRLAERVRTKVSATPGARLDYVAFVDRDSLLPMDTLDSPCLVALAVFMGSTRLIDNLPLP